MMNNRDNLISIIVPCYNEEHAIPYFYKAITEHSTLMKNEFGVDFEYLFINDGSVDNTLTVLKEYASKDNRVKYISFSRNFGKESAMYAGLKKCVRQLYCNYGRGLTGPSVFAYGDVQNHNRKRL